MPVYLEIGPPEKHATRTPGSNGHLVGILDESKAIKGAVTDPDHLQWIELAGCQVKTDQRKNVLSLHCSKVVDGTSTSLMNLATRGSTEEMMAYVHFVKVFESSHETETYMIVTMYAVEITGYSVASRGIDAVESFDLVADGTEVENTAGL